MSEVKVDGYDRAVAQVAKEFLLCAGCEYEFVAGTPGERVYCQGCKLVEEALRWRYEARYVTPLFRMLPRTDVGVTILLDDGEDLPSHCLAGAGMGQLVAVAAATVAFALTIFCLAGWYGLREIAALGIWVAR